MGLAARKPAFAGLRTTKAQTSLRICSNAQEEYDKAWEMKSIPILNILALLLFYN